MPSPMETLFRVQASPVPTQTIFGFCGSTEMAPMDCTVCLSKTGLNVVPPFTDFQTPPLAAPIYTVSRPFSLTAVRAATRPLMVAEPMLRAPSPEMVSESNLPPCANSCGTDKVEVITNRAVKQPQANLAIDKSSILFCGIFRHRRERLTGIVRFDGYFVLAGLAAVFVAGSAKSESSRGRLTSIFSTV